MSGGDDARRRAKMRRRLGHSLRTQLPAWIGAAIVIGTILIAMYLPIFSIADSIG